MPTLERALFEAIIDQILPHVQSEDERREWLIPVLGNQQNLHDLKWGGSARQFATDLVFRLRRDQLIEVLQRLRLGAEQEAPRADLCRRIREAPDIPNPVEKGTANLSSPWLAAQAFSIGVMLVAWMLMALTLGISAPVVQQAAALAAGVIAVGAIGALTVAGMRRWRFALIGTFRQAFGVVLAQSWFGLAISVLGIGATALIGWQIGHWNRVRFVASQEVVLILGDAPGEAKLLGTIKAGETKDLALEVGTHTIAFREVHASENELSVLDPVVVPPPWSGVGRTLVVIPKLQAFGTMREDGR